MKIAILMEPLTTIRPRINSSFGLILAALQRDWQVFHFLAPELSLIQNRVLASGHWLELDLKAEIPVSKSSRVVEDLSSMDIIFLRQDLPPDERFLAATFFLERLEDQCVIINRPSALRNNLDKITFLLLQNLTPADTLLTSSADAIYDALQRHGDIVLKPVYGYQGRGVIRLSSVQQHPKAIIETLLRQATAPFIVQPFMPEVVAGVLRITMFGQEMLGAMNFIPPEGEFRPFHGGEERPAVPSPLALSAAKEAARQLEQRGILLMGFDLIGNNIVDLNLLCAGTFQRMRDVTGIDVPGLILDRAAALRKSG